MDVVITTTKHNFWEPQQNRTAVQFLRLNGTTAKDFTKGEEKKNAFSLGEFAFVFLIMQITFHEDFTFLIVKEIISFPQTEIFSGI